MTATIRPLATAMLVVGLVACPGPKDTDSLPPDDSHTADSPSDTADSQPRDSGSDDTGPDDTGDSPTFLTISPDDPGLRYVGRWSFADPALPTVGWQGASVALRFVGTDLSVTMDAGDRSEAFRVVVDHRHIESTRFMASGSQTTVLAEGLEPGEHQVQLIKETYAGTDLVLHGFELTGQGLLEAPEAARRRMEFYGDSNLAGYSLMSERNEAGTRLQGSHFTFAGVTARAFGADYHNISVSGETLDGMTELYDRQSWYDAGPSWDHAEHPADVVVMNLGANDIYQANEATIRQRYVTMLDLLRTAQPDAHIVVFNGWGWSYDEPADYTAEVVEDYGDPNVSVATFPWVFEQWHGCENDHTGMAIYLIAHISQVLPSWFGNDPSWGSFGEDGDLANGGFEHQAPFGGYGWRYQTDPGVERIEDEDEARTGAFFLRLSDGAEAHQPNPASDGQQVAVTLWLRGSAHGDTAEVTLDFRDQEMWTTPLQSETTTLALTTDWTEHVVIATAPTAAPRPVFHTRLTITASEGTVDVDALEMRTDG